MIKIPERVSSLQTYQAGKPIGELVRERDLKRIVKLASNENPLGPSPKASAAIKKHLSGLHRYVEPASVELSTALAKILKRKPEEIICSHGADSLLGYILLAFTEAGEEVLTSTGTFIGMYVNASKLGRKLTLVPLKNYALDLNAIAQNISPATRVIYLANPNNPTGTIFTKRDFEEFMQRVPKDVLVVLDEAYCIYASQFADYPDGTRYTYENLIVLRTFSKAYGLAGLRIGFAVGPAYLVSELYKLRLPFEPNYLAQVGAMAALKDKEFVRKTIQTNRSSLALMRAKFEQLGIRQVPTWANFILLLMPSEDFARQCYQGCLEQGLIVRPTRAFGIPNGIRINSGTKSETIFALKVIEKVYKGLSSARKEREPEPSLALK